MKKSELIFNLIAIPLDILAISSASIIAYHIRFESDNIVGPILFQMSLTEQMLMLMKILPAIVLIFALLGLYTLRGTRKFWYEFNRTITGLTLGAFIIIVLYFFNQNIYPSRFIILAVWLLSIVFVLCGRIVLKLIQRWLFTKGFGLHKLVLINGSGKEAEIIRNILGDKKFGYQIITQLNNSTDITEQLEQTFIDNPFDEIVQTNHNTSAEDNLKLVAFARQHGLQFSFVPNLFEVQRNIIELTNLQGIPIIGLKNTPLDGWGKVIKRIADILLSLISLIITAPSFFIIAIIIKLDSKGPIIYESERCGQNGKPFKFYKFRSMFTHLSVGDKYGSEKAKEILEELITLSHENRTGPLYKIKDDPRVTKVGRFLRRTKLDELPQFWNVLKGDMSMVGPRPHLPEQIASYEASNERVLTIKPGIFGFTQIAQTAWPALPFEEEIRLDTYYIENWSLMLDAQILLKSFMMLFFEKKPKDNF